MKQASRLKSVFFALVATAIVTIAVDRITLYLWASSVLRQYQRFQLAETNAPTHDQRVPYGGTQPADVLLALEPSLARPNLIAVKGHEVSLIYLPPAFAWTTRLFPPRPRGLHQYAYYRPEEHYGYEIVVMFAIPSGPHPVLYRRTNDSRIKLPPETRSFEWFP